MATYTLFGQPSSPATLTSDSTSYTLGMQFSLSSGAALTGIWFHSASGAGALPTGCAIYDVSSNALVTGTDNRSPSWSGSAGSGWVKCTYDGSVSLSASTNYKVVVQYSGGSNWYSGSSHYWDTGAGASGMTTAIITAPDNASGDGGQDTFYVNTTTDFAYPTSSYNATNYWVDVEVTSSGGGGGGGGTPSQGSPMALLF